MENNQQDNEKDLVEILVSYKGSKVWAYNISGTSILVCPICKSSYFFSESDLMNHLISHAKGYIEKRRGTPSRQFIRREEG
ncbi:hypothetical protein Calag_1194 [Caldisphaera lagunensis DSM 15908]|uniref:Uncharacterized protein n=1 Tax=Caldisphaera lagunensis (strain DSM 15908 / JCM 11604 / ANMR 0165 / IC-154) TaxID=1056495 RepID=L0ABV4_CALLD|nr:hypothetical protein [Caldisphaera lagunensis]AFZ70914.1 hypothetical protein Calag_1194 [Caldisphaera lagunensis DSM 15908]